MSSIYQRSGRWIIQRTVNGARRWGSLGSVSKTFAREVEQQVKRIERARREGAALAPDLAAWIDGLHDEVHAALVAVGLVGVRAAPTAMLPTTIAKLFKDYLARRQDIRPNTRQGLEQAKATMIACLGETKLAADVTPVNAKDWRQWLVNAKYAEATISGYVKKARQVFSDAAERGLIASNPIAKLKAGKQSNRERARFIDRETIAAVMDVADDRWKLVIALSRFGGLRCPSELVDLTWSDINFAKKRMTVRARKTSSTRVLPIFPELLPHLAKAYAARNEAEDGDRVVHWWHKDYNPHTHLLRLLTRGSVKPWPRLWHNLRASRQTELAQQFPAHVVCEWIGNSEAVARNHYLQVTEVDFERAAKSAANRSEPTRTGANLERIGNAESIGTAEKSGVSPNRSTSPIGVEQRSTSGRKLKNRASRAAKSAAIAERYHRRAVGEAYRADLAAAAGHLRKRGGR